MSYVNFEDFKKVEIAIGEILEVEKVPETDKLLKLLVSFGEEKRQIISGISLFFEDISVLVGKKCAFVLNLEPRKIKGLESQGMILAVLAEDNNFSLLEVNKTIPAGTKVS